MDHDILFLRQLMETFKIEADEHLKRITLILIGLEKSDNPDDQVKEIETTFREIHSLKGAARAVNLKSVEALCQVMESTMSLIKKRSLGFTPEVFDVLQDSLDYLTSLIGNLNNDLIQYDPQTNNDLIQNDPQAENDLILRFEGFLEQPIPKVVPEEPCSNVIRSSEAKDIGEKSASNIEKYKTAPNPEIFDLTPSTQRVSSKQLTSVLLQSEDMLTLKLTSNEQVKRIKEINATFVDWTKRYKEVILDQQNRRAFVNHSDLATHREGDEPLTGHSKILFDFVDWSNCFVKHTEETLMEIEKIFKANDLALKSMVDALQEEMKQVAMYPFSSVLDGIPKMVRDFSVDSGKKIDIEISGGEIEIDRRILEALHDPMIHLIRNCVDHGIEKTEERLEKNKVPVGTIRIDVTLGDSMIELIIRDDGRGIDTEVLREVIKEDVKLSEWAIDQCTPSEINAAVFLSGISTSRIITEMSGRGLGLAIVKEKVEKIGGSIELWSEKDVGTQFRMSLPLTIATFRGILIVAGGQKFIIPTRHVLRALRLKNEEVHKIENRDLFYLNNKSIALVDLAETLNLKPSKAGHLEYFQVIIIYLDSQKVAFRVDEVLCEQEVLFKNLGPLLLKVKNVIGATILGSGEVVPVLNALDLLNGSMAMTSGEMNRQEEAMELPTLKMATRVLVAEDSITTRTLLKNILEGSGYKVETAIDGLDALSKLKEVDFELVLSDVDMPKMNGFELTLKIRDQVKTKDLPVILITALASQEDKERGIDVGANAYIIKESFDQKNLLDVMKRLIPKGDAS